MDMMRALDMIRQTRNCFSKPTMLCMLRVLVGLQMIPANNKTREGETCYEVAALMNMVS